MQGRQLWGRRTFGACREGGSAASMDVVRWTLVNAVLLGVMVLAIVGIQALDRGGAAVEASVRRYAAAISNSDLDGAMAEIAPERRAMWQDWVQGQLGNVYDVKGIAVRSPSVLERVFDPAAGRFEVTAIMDVDRDYPDQFYQPTTRVAVEQVDGRWYLQAPFLAQDHAQ
jgi:hypothetical protein